MAGGSGNQNSSIQQVVNAQNLPAWQNQGYQQVASQAFGQAFDPTTGLPNSLPALHNVASESSPLSNYVNAAGNAPTAGNALESQNAFAGYNPNIQANTTPNAFNGYNPNVTTTPVTTSNWNTQTAQQYMNPYTNQVLSAQQALANQQLGIEQAGLNQQAAASGALGGDRQAIAQQQLNNNFNLQQQNLQANALSNAYTTGQQAFNNDANRQLQAGVENSQLGLAAGIQNANLGYGALNATNQLNLSNNAMALQAAEQNAGLNFGALQNTNQLNTAGMYGNLYGINEAGQAGQLQQAYNQSVQDNAYNNAMNQYLFPEQQISYAEGVLNGIPNQWIQQTDVYGAQGNPYSQALNTAAAGAAKGAGGGSGGGNTQLPPLNPYQLNPQNIPGGADQTGPIVTNIPYQFPGTVDSNITYGQPGYGQGTDGLTVDPFGQLPGAPAYYQANLLTAGTDLNQTYANSLGDYLSSYGNGFPMTSAGGSGNGNGASAVDYAGNFWPSYNPYDATGTDGQGLALASLGTNPGNFDQYSNMPNYTGYDGMTSPDFNGVTGDNDPFQFA